MIAKWPQSGIAKRAGNPLGGAIGNVIIVDQSLRLAEEDIITINSIDDLEQLHRRIGAMLLAYRREQEQDRFISSVEAREIARAKGIDLPTTTLVSAYGRGSIAHARKIPNSNRWESPLSSFLEWLERWEART